MLEEIGGVGERIRCTFAILARRYERSRNLNRSSSVCITTSVKFDDGSIVPVISSTREIYCGSSANRSVIVSDFLSSIHCSFFDPRSTVYSTFHPTLVW